MLSSSIRQRLIRTNAVHQDRPDLTYSASLRGNNSVIGDLIFATGLVVTTPMPGSKVTRKTRIAALEFGRILPPAVQETSLIGERYMTVAPRNQPSVRPRQSQRRNIALIDGKWVPAKSGETFPVEDPATEETIAHVPAGDKADIDLAVAAARRAFETGPWSCISPGDRSKIVWRLGDLLERYSDELAELEAR